MTTWTEEQGSTKGTEIERRSESIASNRPESRGLHPVGALARTHQKKVFQSKEGTKKKVRETYRVIAVEKLEVLGHGDGEVRHPIVGHVHGTMRRDRETV